MTSQMTADPTGGHSPAETSTASIAKRFATNTIGASRSNHPAVPDQYLHASGLAPSSCDSFEPIVSCEVMEVYEQNFLDSL